ncbi:MAG: OmpH family outer membrane protein [Acidobacteria bacterium]|nr:OmpH family outer membrane protein [Acidobacteriota bacterium]
MKKLIFAFALSSLLAIVAFAQTPTPPATRPAATGTTPASTAAAGGTGAEGKVAYINTAQFRIGVQELKTRMDALNTEFEPKKKEIQAGEEALNNLKSRIQNQGSTVSPQVRAQWVEEATENERNLKRKAEDYESQGNKRLAEISQPVYDKVGEFLRQYCQQRGIVLVLEGGAAAQAGVLLWASPATDITEDFMKEYNKVHPAGAATAAPAPKKP